MYNTILDDYISYLSGRTGNARRNTAAHTRQKRRQTMGRRLSFAVILFLLCAAFASGVGAAPPDAPVPEIAASPTAFAGAGTAADPYLLSDAADLFALAGRVNGGDNCAGLYFALTADVDLGGADWTPIGLYYDPSPLSALPFSGHFDGRGHTISRFSVALQGKTGYTTALCGGLFGYVCGSVTRLAVSEATVSVSATRTGYAGGIAGYLAGTVSDCYANATVSATSSAGSAAAGGLVGYSRGDVAACISLGQSRATASASQKSAWVGGAVGRSDGTLCRVFAAGNPSVSAKTPQLAFGGAVVGENGGKAADLCYSEAGYFAGLGDCLPLDRQKEASALAQLLLLSADWQTEEGTYPRFAGCAAVSVPASCAEGSVGNPLPVATAAALKGMRADRSYRLTADIALSGNFAPLAVYYGYFRGNGKTLSGISVTGSSYENFGLFGVLCGTVDGLSLSGVCRANNANGGYAGLLCGRLLGTAVGVSGSGQVTNTSKYTSVSGGLVGQCRGGLLSDCTADVTVSGIKGTILCVYGGGMVGQNSGTVRRCTAMGNVDCTSTLQYPVAGGFVGQNDGEITDCAATGNAIALAYGEIGAAGGFVGQQTGGSLVRCVAQGNANARADDGSAHAGGFTGMVRGGSLLACFAGGGASATAQPAEGCHAGVFFGSADGGTWESCHVTAASSAAAQTQDKTVVPTFDDARITLVSDAEMTADFFLTLGFSQEVWQLADGRLPALV